MQGRPEARVPFDTLGANTLTELVEAEYPDLLCMQEASTQVCLAGPEVLRPPAGSLVVWIRGHSSFREIEELI